jgi:glycosyltransferase involved in cell wall biosynthesis
LRIEIIGSALSIHTVKWANFLHAEGVDVHINSMDGRNSALHNCISVKEIPTPKNFFPFLRSLREITVQRKLSKPDLIHVHSLGTYALVAIMSRARDYISTPWGSDVILSGKNPLKKMILWLTFRQSRFFTCDSVLIHDLLLSKNVDNERIAHINFGIDTKIFCKIPVTSKNENSEEFGSKFTIISTRSFEPIYSVDTLILAFAEVIKTDKDTRLILVGDGTLKLELQILVESLKLNDFVQFVGRVDNAQLPYLLNNADVYVSTSISDAGLASSTAEAMACELVCIVSDVRENSRWVKENVSGFLYPIGSHLNLAQKILYVKENLNDLSDIRKNARVMIEANNNFQLEMTKMLNIYTELINNG